MAFSVRDALCPQIPVCFVTRTDPHKTTRSRESKQGDESSLSRASVAIVAGVLKENRGLEMDTLHTQVSSEILDSCSGRWHFLKCELCV